MFIWRRRPKKTDRKRGARLKAKLKRKDRKRIARNAGKKR